MLPANVSKRVAVSLVVAVLCLPAAACFDRPAKPASKVLVLGLDAGTWDLLDGYIERGLLPNLARLRSEGASGALKSIRPSSSPVIWTTVATSKRPVDHGITFFVRYPDGPKGKPAPVTRTLRKTKAVWNILSDHEKDVAVVGWMITWPAEEVNGRLISDRAHYGQLDHESYPPGYLAELDPMPVARAIQALPEFMTINFDPAKVRAGSEDPEEQVNFLVSDRFIRAYRRDSFFLEAADRVLADGRLPDVAFVYLRGTDDVQHGFWKFMDPEPFEDGVPEQQQRDFGRVIERYWAWTDKAVGRILEHYDEDTLVLVISDHGAGPAVGKFLVETPSYLHLSGSHRQRGIVIAHGPGVRRGETIEESSVYDITPTILHYLGLPVADDMVGTVTTGLFEPSIGEREPARVATYETGGSVAEDIEDKEVDEKVLEHLRSLGYIGE